MTFGLTVNSDVNNIDNNNSGNICSASVEAVAAESEVPVVVT